MRLYHAGCPSDIHPEQGGTSWQIIVAHRREDMPPLVYNAAYHKSKRLAEWNGYVMIQYIQPTRRS